MAGPDVIWGPALLREIKNTEFTQTVMDEAREQHQHLLAMMSRMLVDYVMRHHRVVIHPRDTTVKVDEDHKFCTSTYRIRWRPITHNVHFAGDDKILSVETIGETLTTVQIPGPVWRPSWDVVPHVSVDYELFGWNETRACWEYRKAEKVHDWSLTPVPGPRIQVAEAAERYVRDRTAQPGTRMGPLVVSALNDWKQAWDGGRHVWNADWDHFIP